MTKPYFVLLARHGRHSRHVLLRSEPGKEDSPYPSEIVGDVLSEHLRWLPPIWGRDGRINLGAALFAPSPEARKTLELLGHALGRITPDGRMSVTRHDPDLPPFEFVAVEDPDLHAGRALAGKSQKGLVRRVRKAAVTGEGNAVLVVGHQPQLSRLADEMAHDPECPGHRRWSRLRIPIAPGEVACLILAEPYRIRPGHRPPRLLWTVGPSDGEAMSELHDKIKSKSDTAKILGTAITFVLGAVVALLTNGDRWNELGEAGRLIAQIAAALLLASFVLYLATVYAYDRLTMPPRFWTDLGPRRRRPLRRGRGIVARPPSSAVWVLYQHMQRVWWGLFTTATVGFVAALSLMAVVFLRGHVHPSPAWLGWAGFGVTLVAGLCYWFRPVLGSED